MAKAPKSSANAAPKGPQLLRCFAPIVEALRELGNSGRAGEVTDVVIDRIAIDDDELEATTISGQSRVKNQVGWARFYLVKAGLIDGTQRGVWTLTEAGQSAKLTVSEVTALFKAVHEKFQGVVEADAADEEERVEAVLATDFQTDRDAGHSARAPGGSLRAAVPAALARERIQGGEGHWKSGDGGIDGHGVLEVNLLATFKVLFQCERYSADNKVGPSQVRDVAPTASRLRGRRRARGPSGARRAASSRRRGGRRRRASAGAPSSPSSRSRGAGSTRR